MKISIIMPTKNAAQFLEHALGSFYSQAWSQKQLVLIDGGSTDATVSIAQKLRTNNDIVHIQADQNATEAVIRGVAMSDGDVVGVLMADDWLAPGAMEAIAGAFASDFKLDMVCGGVQQWDHTGPAIRMEHTISAPKGETLTLPRLLGVPYMAAFTFRRRAWDLLKGFASDYRYGADRDFLVRARLARLPARALDPIVYNYRRHQGSRTLADHDDVVRDFLSDHRLMAARWLRSKQLTVEERRVIAAWRRNETLALAERQIGSRNYRDALGMLAADLVTQPSVAVAGGKQVLRHVLARVFHKGVG